MTKTLLLNVSQKAIDTAWKNAKNRDLSTQCLLATAARLQFPRNKICCGMSRITIGQNKFLISKVGQKLVYLWMDARWSKTNKPQPCRIRLTVA